MITVIIAGGSGTRLWPLSTPHYPKHLLALTGSKSLIQYAYDRAKASSDHVYVITEASHAHHVQDHLADLPKENFIIEPARRGTASCIVIALAHIAKNHAADEPIAFMHADHYIRDKSGFARSFATAAKVSTKTDRIVLIGVEPDRPDVGFGYIQKGDICEDNLLAFDVKAFKEKPDFATAQKYLESGQYLWNGGYFVGSLTTFLDAMAAYSPELKKNYDKLHSAKNNKELEERYLTFENEAIDYALIEKVPNLLVIPATFDWMDLGSYGDLHKAVGSDEQGNHIRGKNVEIAGVENSLIRNDEDKPVAVIGLDNVAVINTPQGLLVTRKDLAQQVGEISKKISAKETK